MKKCILLLAYSLSLCYSQTHDRMIYDIHKNESQLLESNIVHYTMCKNWNLTAEDIDIIINNKNEEVYYEDVMIQYAYGKSTLNFKNLVVLICGHFMTDKDYKM